MAMGLLVIFVLSLCSIFASVMPMPTETEAVGLGLKLGAAKTDIDTLVGIHPIIHALAKREYEGQYIKTRVRRNPQPYEEGDWCCGWVCTCRPKPDC